MRVLMLRSSRGFFGAERVVLDLSKQLPGEGITACVGCLENLREPHLELFGHAVDAGLETASFPTRGRLSFSTVGAIRHALDSGGFDVLHVHGYKTLLLGLPAAKAARCPVVATLHGETGESLPVRVYERLARAAWARCARVVGVSAGLYDMARARCGDRALHIPNGVDVGAVQARVAAADHPEDEGPVVLAIGRLSFEKGHAVLLAAVAQLPEPRPKVVVAGSGILAGALARQAERAGLDVELPGYVDDVAPLLARATVLVQPSLAEGLPLTVLEAMASGVPVLATAVGDLPQVLSDGAGHVVPPERADALAGGLAQLLADGPGRETMAARGRERVQERYDIRAVARRYVDEVYHPVAEGR